MDRDASDGKRNLEKLLETLVTVSEKAARIARRMRANQLEKLVERKLAGEANPRFLQDFKTLADVLIQTMVRRYVDPRIRVDGEENGRFYSASLQKEVVIELGGSTEENVSMLNKVLDDPDAATTYIHEVEKDVKLSDVHTHVPNDGRLRVDFDYSKLGIWIDPIDATNEFIAGHEEKNEESIYTKGLKCVTVLIGAYDLQQGAPVLGVINQPFFEKEIDHGFKCNWGVRFADIKANSLSPSTTSTLRICVGAGEDEATITKLKRAGCDILVASGAGYKLLCVIKGIADAYVLTKPTTYVWDTCAAHAILLSMGGNIVDATGVRNKEKRDLTYLCRGEDASKCHKGGIVAYRDESVLDQLIVVLSS